MPHEGAPPKYKHSPLAGKASIRLIRIHPNLHDKRLACTLEHFDATANANTCPEYVALSYVWGDPTPRHPIYINGLVRFIHTNLWLFLRRAWMNGAVSWFWTDCLSLDQHSHAELNVQHDPPPAPLLDMGELKRWSFYRAAIAEFIATFLFLFFAVSTVVNYKEPNYTDQCSRVGYLGIAWANGGMIFVLVYCTSGISGGHLNPAVTFGMLVARKMSLIRAAAYMLAQCLGAILGHLFVFVFMYADEQQSSVGVVNVVSRNYSKGAGLGAEFIGTFVLVYTVFSATDPKRNARDSHVPVLAPLPIGFAVFVVHLATIPITGTGINPARSLATNLIHRSTAGAMDDLWIFWVGPFLGALAAAVYHKYVLRAGAVKTLKSFRALGSFGSQPPV